MNKMNLARKEEVVKFLGEIINTSSIAVVASFSGLSVANLEKLRRRLKEQESSLQVVKNTLLRRACEQTQARALIDFINGPIFIAWSKEDDETGLVKTLVEFSGTSGQLNLRAGYLRGEILNSQQLAALAQLPGVKQLRANFVLQLQAPLNRLLYCFQYPARKLVESLKCLTQKKEKENGKSGNGCS